MKKHELLDLIDKYTVTPTSRKVLRDAVEAYSKALLQQADVKGSMEFEKQWLRTCIEDAMVTAEYQDEQWRDSDTVENAVQKIMKVIPLGMVW